MLKNLMEAVLKKSVLDSKLKNKQLQNTLMQLKSNIKILNFCDFVKIKMIYKNIFTCSA